VTLAEGSLILLDSGSDSASGAGLRREAIISAPASTATAASNRELSDLGPSKLSVTYNPAVVTCPSFLMSTQAIRPVTLPNLLCRVVIPDFGPAVPLTLLALFSHDIDFGSP
jgi:hypothetical protein